MKRLVLLGVAALLCAAALLAIGILVAGRFGDTEQRVLGTTLLLAGYGLLALPAALLLERARLRPLGWASTALAAAAAALALLSIWGVSDNDRVGRLVATATLWALASAQTCGLQAWTPHPTPPLRRLFAASVATAIALAAFLTALLWTQPEASVYARLAGALAVLDVLLVALQPLLARATMDGGRPPRAAVRGR